MFCDQCQETVKNKGCTVAGVCGKNEEVANLQDLILYLLKGIGYLAYNLRQQGEVDEKTDRFILEALFITITNVNFDSKKMIQIVEKALAIRDELKTKLKAKNLPESVLWHPDNGKKSYLNKAAQVGFLSIEDADLRSLVAILIYGLKGLVAYADHALILGKKDPVIFEFIEKTLAYLAGKNLESEQLLALILETGQMGVKTMALLDGANTTKYGNPEITEVNTGVESKPAILVSGHDLLDLEEILIQSEGKEINVYTHGEMLPANAYPELKKYKHLKGNYGSSWYNQQKEFDGFGGAIVMTTNCLQKPKNSYEDRIFTTGLVGWPGISHIANRQAGKSKNFSSVIEKALLLGPIDAKAGKKIVIGFAHGTLLGVADKIISAVKSGKIKRFFVMAGCDGRSKEREYFTQLAEKLPADTVILTAGCAKYRYNLLDLGQIDGIPRVIDAGQCNDSYSLVVVALKLAEIFKVKDVNDLPISFDIAWYEQKAVLVLLALLSLGVKNIRLGPTLPAFVSPSVLNVLVDKFNLKPTQEVEKDIELMLQGK